MNTTTTSTYITKRNKFLSYILLLISPFFSLLLALRHWKLDYAKNILIGVIVFIGITALPEGDIERYQAYFYYNATQSFEVMWHNLITLQEGKFYIGISIFLFGLFFDHHNVYLGFLFFIFGYYLVNFVFLVYNKNQYLKKTKFTFFLFVTFALFFSIRNSLNLAFYTGAIYILYWITKSVFNDYNYRYLIPILFAPLFHFSLALIFIPIGLFLLLKSKTYVCVLLVMISYAIPQVAVTTILGNLASDNEGNLVEDKYESYASDGGMKRLEDRYEKGALNANFKLSLLNNIRAFIFDYLINIGLLIILFFYKKFKKDKLQLYLYNLILLLFAISNIMLNISNGNRFQIFHLTLTVVFFLLFYQNQIKSKIVKAYYMVVFPFLFIFGIMNLYASNKLISINFYVSNYFIEIIAPTTHEKSN
jgi:hypothetical protein